MGPWKNANIIVYEKVATPIWISLILSNLSPMLWTYIRGLTDLPPFRLPHGATLFLVLVGTFFPFSGLSRDFFFHFPVNNANLWLVVAETLRAFETNITVNLFFGRFCFYWWQVVSFGDTSNVSGYFLYPRLRLGTRNSLRHLKYLLRNHLPPIETKPPKKQVHKILIWCQCSLCWR